MSEKIKEHIHLGGGSGPVTVAQCLTQPNCEDGKSCFSHAGRK